MHTQMTLNGNKSQKHHKSSKLSAFLIFVYAINQSVLTKTTVNKMCFFPSWTNTFWSPLAYQSPNARPLMHAIVLEHMF